MPKSVPPSPSSPSASTTPPEPKDALAAFRARLESGRFATVLGRPLRRTIHDAAADTGLDAEVGALRLALARLLTEERDPSRLAAGVSRLTAVAVQAARLRQPADDGSNELRDAFLRTLEEYEAELAAERAATQYTPPLAPYASPLPDAESPSPCAQGEGLG